jgi:hypothetical protein
LTSALVGDKLPVSNSGLWIRGWVVLKVNMDDMEKLKLLTLSGIEPRPLGGPTKNI